MPEKRASENGHAQLKLSREEADRAYNDALTELDRALPSQINLSHPTSEFSSQQISALNEAWHLLPDEGPEFGKGWRARLNGFIWRLIGPIIQRQQQFNTLVVDHIREQQESSDRVIDVIKSYVDTLGTFQSKLIQYLQQITPYVDTKDGKLVTMNRGTLGALDGLTEELRKRAETAVTREQRFTQHVVELRTTVGRVQHGMLALRREIENLASGESMPHARNDSKMRLDEAFDAYTYVGFENIFRGSQEEIRARMYEYLPFFEGASDVLDIGCGRGEFLDLLREAGVTARGIDINAEMIKKCHERGLEADVADALTFLESKADDSLGGLFTAQVIEHLQPDYLVRLLAVAGRKLKPGSTIVLETINPACWFAFFDAYVRDITHVRPIHPDTLKYLLSASGFQQTTVRYRAPYPEDAKLQHVVIPKTQPDRNRTLEAALSTVNKNVDKLNGLLFTHLDYAAIGQRL